MLSCCKIYIRELAITMKSKHSGMLRKDSVGHMNEDRTMKSKHSGMLRLLLFLLLLFLLR